MFTVVSGAVACHGTMPWPNCSLVVFKLGYSQAALTLMPVKQPPDAGRGTTGLLECNLLKENFMFLSPFFGVTGRRRPRLTTNKATRRSRLNILDEEKCK